jgi:hypothetical protein
MMIIWGDFRIFVYKEQHLKGREKMLTFSPAAQLNQLQRLTDRAISNV